MKHDMACGAHGACSSHESDGLMSPSTNESSDGHPSQAAATAAHTCTRRRSAALCGALRRSLRTMYDGQCSAGGKRSSFASCASMHIRTCVPATLSTAVLKVFCGYPWGLLSRDSGNSCEYSCSSSARTGACKDGPSERQRKPGVA